jgi:hypothetical protein
MRHIGRYSGSDKEELLAQLSAWAFAHNRYRPYARVLRVDKDARAVARQRQAEARLRAQVQQDAAP